MDKECDEDEEISSFATKQMVMTHAYNSTLGTHIVLEIVSLFTLALRMIVEDLRQWVSCFYFFYFINLKRYYLIPRVVTEVHVLGKKMFVH